MSELPDVMNIRVSRRFFETLIAESCEPETWIVLEWGEPDADGFYNPEITKHYGEHYWDYAPEIGGEG